MKMRIAQTALATILAIGLNSPSHAFMSLETETPQAIKPTISETVELLRKEITLGETSCDEMLKKLDVVLEDIDGQLDAGAENEEELLTARDAITDMRYDLECLSKELTQAPMVNGPAPGGEFSMDLGGPAQPQQGGQMSSGGGPTSGGGGSIGGGGSLRGLAIVGGLGGAAAGIASDDDNPGFRASGSTTN